MRPIAIPLIAVMLLCIPLGRCSETRADYVTGTGFVVHPDGWIVTCNHVIECAAEPRDQSIVVQLNGREYSARTIRVDAARDLALLHITGSGLTPLRLETNDDSVYMELSLRAYGYPLGSQVLDVSPGVVRSVDYQPAYYGSEQFQAIRTDAPINRGNSGGPLVTDMGRVVGVANSKIAEASNYCYAVHVRYVRNLLRDESLLGFAPESQLPMERAELAGLAQRAVCRIVVQTADECASDVSRVTVPAKDYWSLGTSVTTLADRIEELDFISSVQSHEDEGMIECLFKIGDYGQRILVYPKTDNDEILEYIYLASYFPLKQRYAGLDREKEQILEWINRLNTNSYTLGYYISDGKLLCQYGVCFSQQISFDAIESGLRHFVFQLNRAILSSWESAERYLDFEG